MLKARGTLAAFCYASGFPSLTPASAAIVGEAKAVEVNAKLKGVFLDIYERVLGPFFHRNIARVIAEYRGLELSSASPGLFDVEKRENLTMSRPMPLSAVAGVVTTWSGHANYIETTKVARGSKDDPAVVLLDKMTAILRDSGLVNEGVQESETEVAMNWPLFVLLARRKA